MRCVVTGGKGFIGRRVVAGLKQQGHDVKVVDIENRGILNKQLLHYVLRDTDVVFHLGAVSGSPFFTKDPVQGVETNCVGTATLLEECRKREVSQIVFSSTMSSYAFCTLPHVEDGPTTVPNLYTGTKLFGENMMNLYHELYGMKTVTLRYSSVYGPGEETKGAVMNAATKFCHSVIKNEKPIIYGDGTQTRDLIYVDDVVRANLIAWESKLTGLYNVSTGKETSYNEIVRILGEIASRTIEIDYHEWKGYSQQKPYIDRQWASYEKFHRITGWAPRIDVREGLTRIYKSIVEKTVPKVDLTTD